MFPLLVECTMASLWLKGTVWYRCAQILVAVSLQECLWDPCCLDKSYRKT